MPWRCISACGLWSVILFQPINVLGQDDSGVPSQDLQIGGDERKRYFLIGPMPENEAPKKGFGLVVVMPGGAGGADFHPFVKNIFKHALPEGYLVAQPVAVKWTPSQQIVWPTRKNKVKGQKFSTEKFVEAVIADVRSRHKLDRRRIFTLSWSSSGPAAYAIALQKKTAVVGSFIAMSVFKPDYLPTLKRAKGRSFYLFHSKGDRICPYRMAEEAGEALEENGAFVTLATYEGGHGWRGQVFGNIRDGVRWLEQSVKKAAKKEKSKKKKKKKKKKSSD
ncbi:MAG: hypothetical protein MI923_07520 [Phycisphaerales bacterium]|nr:hypothetical protein [Phycisphaerales bacterium]